MTSTSAERWKLSASSERTAWFAPARAGNTGEGGGDGIDLAEMARLGAPIAGMRAQFSRMPRSDRPNGELISRRAARKTHEQHRQRIAVGGIAEEIELESAEQRPHAMPCNPSSPPVSQLALLAASSSQQAQPERDHDQRKMAEARNDETRWHSRPGLRRAAANRPEMARPRRISKTARRYRRQCRKRRHGQATPCRHSRGSDRARARTARRSRSGCQRQIGRERHKRQQRRKPEHDFERLPAAERCR